MQVDILMNFVQKRPTVHDLSDHSYWDHGYSVEGDYCCIELSGSLSLGINN